MSDKIVIFDTTLRDGEQSPGMSMNLEEKLLMAETLDFMGVDVIEAGFAMASNGDFESVQAVARQAKNAIVCSLARAKPADIERAAEALKPAKRGRIHTFISTSPIHLQYQFKLTEEEALAVIKETVAFARRFTDDVEWSAMDATRTSHEFLARAVETAISAGATTINIPDTVGFATPMDITEYFTNLRKNVQNFDKAIFSFHGHNDLGLGTANALAAIMAGARQIECTINGIGERAGNTALEEVVMALKVRKDRLRFDTGIKTEHITRASRLIQSITGQAVQVNKAIVGANAFAHESGIHQDGMLKHAGTYEIMTPESVGLTRSNLVMGKHSGRHAFREKLKELGFELGDNAFEDVFARFKDLADKKKDVYDDDLIALVEPRVGSGEKAISLVSMQVACGTEGAQKVTLALQVEGETKTIEMEGNGPVDALFKAIRALVPGSEDTQLKLYQVHAVTQGTDAQAEVTVRLDAAGTLINGNASDVDTLVASALAYINALAKVDTLRNKEVKTIC